jgi:hypothetical protein
MALRHPEAVRGLVLASGYYYPLGRVDAVAMSGPAVPVLGDALRYTIAPIACRLMWPRLMRKIFGPAPVPANLPGSRSRWPCAHRRSGRKRRSQRFWFRRLCCFRRLRDQRGASGDRCRRRRSPDRPGEAVAPASRRHPAQCLPSRGGQRAHGASDGSPGSDGGSGRGGRTPGVKQAPGLPPRGDLP